MKDPAYFSAINVHNCRRITAVAESAINDPNTAWLTIRFSDDVYPDCNMSVFMPLDRAERIAAAINAADAPIAAQHAAALAAE